MRRILLMGGLAVWLLSCANNEGSTGTGNSDSATTTTTNTTTSSGAAGTGGVGAGFGTGGQSHHRHRQGDPLRYQRPGAAAINSFPD